MSKSKKTELLILFLYSILISVIAVILKFSYLQMTIFMSVIPALYFLFKNKSYTKKISFESLLFALPFSVILEVIAHSSHSWYEHSSFTFRIFDLFPVESLIWGASYYILIVSLYEYFFDKDNKPHFNKRFKAVLILIYSALVITLLCMIFSPQFLEIPYFYTLFLSIVLILTIIISIKSPIIFKRGLYLSLFLFIPSILHELISIELGHWVFTKGYHLAYINLLNFTLPVEEIIWLPLLPIWIVLFYEAFQDDFK